MKENRSDGKRKLCYGFKKLLYFVDTKAFSRKLGKYKLSSVQKIYICNLTSNADLASHGSYCLSSIFYSHGREEEETKGR